MTFGKQGRLIHRFLATAAAVVLLAGVASAQTQTTDTLADLVTNHGTLSLGDKVFSDFTFQESGLTSFDPSNIQVTLSIVGGTYFLTWDGNMSLTSSSGPVTADLVLGYSVTATGGLIDSIDASFTGSAQPFTGAFLAVDETARNANGNVVGSTHLDAQHRSDSFPIAPPQAFLRVTKDVGFAISNPNGGFVSISEIGQSFHQAIPEPATTMLFGSGLLSGVLYLRRRRR
jgi:hypothetical protein